jgi:hypothetical protein
MEANSVGLAQLSSSSQRRVLNSFFETCVGKRLGSGLLKTTELLNRGGCRTAGAPADAGGLAGDYAWAALSAGVFDRNPATYCRENGKVFLTAQV